jgi:hypothetical protein
MTRRLHPRNLWIALAVAVAVGIPVLQAVLPFGISQAAFAAQGDATLRAAGPAFAIWGLIYAWLIVMAFYQLTSAGRAAPILRQISIPAALAIALCGAWIAAAALNLRWLTVAIIFTAAVLLVWSLARADPVHGRDRWLILIPLHLLAGWLTIAAGLNLMTVLTAEGWIEPQLYWSAVGIGGVFTAAAWSALRLNSPLYLTPVIWGFLWVFQAMAGEAGWAALAAGGALAVLAVALLLPARSMPALLGRR